jgi:hypothetical protein
VRPDQRAPQRRPAAATGGSLDKLISDLRAKEAEIAVLEKRVAELEAENRRLWGAMRATGELLRKFLPEGNETSAQRRHAASPAKTISLGRDFRPIIVASPARVYPGASVAERR